MRFHSVESFSDLPTETDYYALAIFSSGFERRATFIAQNFNRYATKRVLVLGFEAQLDVLSRQENDRFFSAWAGSILNCSEVDDDKVLFSALDDAAQTNQDGPLRILVDYSVMTRAWYGAILTWARFATLSHNIEIDFVYASGKYMGDFRPLAISDIISLPGFEGTSGGFRRTTAIFGLGYDKYATLAVYDRIEPDRVYCCIAERYPDDEASLKALKENDVLVESALKVIKLPLIDVPSAFRLLADQILGMDRSTHIVIVPMGPKTHVLVTLLVALRMPWITCLHARGSRTAPVQVEADGTIALSRVTFCNDVAATKEVSV